MVQIEVDFVVGDITDSSTSEKAVKLAISKFGQLNSIIANAGVLEPVGPINPLLLMIGKGYMILICLLLLN